MGIFGQTAVLATKIATSRDLPPGDAWDLAVAVAKMTDSLASQTKGCPRSAYLGLCEAGVVVGIKAGKYASRRSGENGRYALEAYRLLRSEPTLRLYPDVLWDNISEPKAKNENGQMDVVIALWNQGLLQ